jgi:hypothetical protein
VWHRDHCAPWLPTCPRLWRACPWEGAIVSTDLRCLLVRGHLKCDGTRAETGFRLSAKQTSPFKSAGASVQSTTVSRGLPISGINAGYTMFRGSVKGTGYPLHSPVSPSLPFLCVTTCHHISTGVYHKRESGDRVVTACLTTLLLTYTI